MIMMAKIMIESEGNYKNESMSKSGSKTETQDTNITDIHLFLCNTGFQVHCEDHGSKRVNTCMTVEYLKIPLTMVCSPANNIPNK